MRVQAAPEEVAQTLRTVSMSSSARPALRFGISVTPTASDYPQIVEQVLAAERGGLDLVGIQDHPYQRRFLDTFALIADLQARTSRIRFFPDVASLPMRPPPMLAKAAVSLDHMSGGRFELGIGAGNFWDAVIGMGGPNRVVGERGDALEEAVRLIRAALDVGSERALVRGPGPYYPIPGYPAGPPPAHRVEIWIGAMAPRALDLIGRLADGWIPGAGVSRIDDFPGLMARIDKAAQVAGRDRSAIRRIVNVSGTITDGSRGAGPLDGPAEHWAETLGGWAETLGIDSFVFWPPDAGTGQIDRFAADVVPAVRAAVPSESA
jgi:alkanesulfonate monooxygenase SsuD/methylene tetrahydromethanopterin reductase-like flavin-dependent oxidoreductase (luciferase family)